MKTQQFVPKSHFSSHPLRPPGAFHSPRASTALKAAQDRAEPFLEGMSCGRAALPFSVTLLSHRALVTLLRLRLALAIGKGTFQRKFPRVQTPSRG